MATTIQIIWIRHFVCFIIRWDRSRTILCSEFGACKKVSAKPIWTIELRGQTILRYRRLRYNNNKTIRKNSNYFFQEFKHSKNLTVNYAIL
uniref:Uncharacterized protein n=1 Tax=Strigamia maritima TaxID=126957 RepID=T1J1C9_STRMM